jgi:hypothetical protein
MRSEEEMLRRIEERVSAWGTGAFAAMGFLPSLGTHPDAVKQLARLERLTFSPGALRAMYRQNMLIDVRPILPIVRAPTLVLHRLTDLVVRPENGRYLASQISGAKYIEYDDCSDHLIFAGNMRTLSGDIEEFITGDRGAAAVSDTFDRVLATVLFTDIVGSTRRAVMRSEGDPRPVCQVTGTYALPPERG